MQYLSRLFTGSPNTVERMQRHGSAGLLATRDHTLTWVRRDAAATRGQIRSHVPAPR